MWSNTAAEHKAGPLTAADCIGSPNRCVSEPSSGPGWDASIRQLSGFQDGDTKIGPSLTKGGVN